MAGLAKIFQHAGTSAETLDVNFAILDAVRFATVACLCEVTKKVSSRCKGKPDSAGTIWKDG
jgi:hypothetical protein